jgi:adenine deaminase
VVACENRALFTNTDRIPEFTRNTVHIHDRHLDVSSYHLFAQPSSLAESAEKAWVQCVEMYDGYFKRAFHAALPLNPESPYNILCDIENDVLKVAIVDRHHGTPNRGIAFVRGFRLKRGAIAATTNCENQNLVVVGVDDESIAAAVQAMRSLGGGLLAVSDKGERVLGTVKLDIGGCMSSDPWEVVRDTSLELDRLVREELGCTMEQNPFLIASFIGLVAVPDLGLTELGLVVGGGEALMDPVLRTEPVTMGLSGSQKVEAEPDIKAVRVCCRCPSHLH